MLSLIVGDSIACLGLSIDLCFELNRVCISSYRINGWEVWYWDTRLMNLSGLVSLGEVSVINLEHFLLSFF